MKKTLTFITGCILITGMCFLIYSCVKKQDVAINSMATAPDDLIQAAKDWRNQQIQPPNVQGGTSAFSINTTSKGKLLPNWKGAGLQTLSNGSQIVVVPGPIPKLSINATAGVVRKFVFTVNGNHVTGGNIVEIYASPDYIAAHKDNLLENYNDGRISGDFNGAVITYDMNYNYIGSKVYNNGVISSNTTARISNSKQLIATNGKSIQSMKTLDDTCIDYYEVFYSNGVEIYEYYLYTVCSGDNGNELGGDPGSPGSQTCTSIVNGKIINDACIIDQCAQEKSDLSADVVCVADATPISVSDAIISPDDANTRTKLYTWKFAKALSGLFYFVSQELGTHHFDGSRWSWQTLTHQGHTMVGSVFIGTVTLTMTSAISSIQSADVADMQLNYNVVGTLTCSGISFTTAHPLVTSEAEFTL